MCCTFGDTTDIVWWQKHKLPIKIILNKQGRIKNCTVFDTKEANEIFASIIGLNVGQARNKIIEFLTAKGFILKSVSLTHTVKCAERSGAPLEIITASQWFVRAVEHKQDLLKKSSEINWYPYTMKIKLDNWINAISWDWCISRQRFFGIPFPVWYSKRKGEEGKILFATNDQLPVDPIKDLPLGYSRDEVIADMDVMDTWATSAVSPQLSSLAINENFFIDYERHKSLFPFDLRPQAHEILRTWAFYTILKSYLHENKLPWKNIMISGWCLAEDKTKMSKSKGNSVSPIDLIENYGADAIRYWASTSRLGVDTAFSEDMLKIGKKLMNKIWNASKFVSSHFSKIDLSKISTFEEAIENKIIFHDVDLWIIGKLRNTVDLATRNLEIYEYAVAREFVENFFWKDFCDNYLEISKSRCYNEDGSDDKGQKSAILTLYYILQILLKLFSIYMPHITEEIYQSLYDIGNSIHSRGNWPVMNMNIDTKAIKFGSNLVAVLDMVRKIKTAKNLSMKASIKKLYVLSSMNFTDLILADMKNVTNSEKILMVDKFEDNSELISDENGNSIVVQWI